MHGSPPRHFGIARYAFEQLAVSCISHGFHSRLSGIFSVSRRGWSQSSLTELIIRGAAAASGLGTLSQSRNHFRLDALDAYDRGWCSSCSFLRASAVSEPLQAISAKKQLIEDRGKCHGSYQKGSLRLFIVLANSATFANFCGLAHRLFSGIFIKSTKPLICRNSSSHKCGTYLDVKENEAAQRRPSQEAAVRIAGNKVDSQPSTSVSLSQFSAAMADHRDWAAAMSSFEIESLKNQGSLIASTERPWGSSSGP